MKLTGYHKRQLLELYEASALSRATGARPHDLALGDLLVLAKLRDLGLADSASVCRLGVHWRAWWLTPAGIEQAKALLQGEPVA